MKITIAHVTGRSDPKWNWFVDSLAHQIPQDERRDIQFIFVDGLLWRKDIEGRSFTADSVRIHDTALHDAGRRKQLEEIVRGRFEYTHVPVMPSVVQGPFRLTPDEWFDASSARNTALLIAAAPFIAFQDDLACPAQTWWPEVRAAVDRSGITEGSYQKMKKMVVEDGILVSWEDHPSGRDHRWNHGRDDMVVPGHASWLFGCCFAAPVEPLFDVNLYDINCQTLGLEDSLLGIRLWNNGHHAFWYSRAMFSPESEEDHHVDGNRYKRTDKGISPNDKSHALLRMAQTSSIAPQYWGPGGARSVREQYHLHRTLPIPKIPQHDWYDGQPFSEFK